MLSCIKKLSSIVMETLFLLVFQVIVKIKRLNQVKSRFFVQLLFKLKKTLLLNMTNFYFLYKEVKL